MPRGEVGRIVAQIGLTLGVSPLTIWVVLYGCCYDAHRPSFSKGFFKRSCRSGESVRQMLGEVLLWKFIKIS